MKASGSGVKRSQVVPLEAGGSGTYRAAHGYGSGDDGGGSAASYGSAHDPVSPAQRRAGGSSDALAERTYSAGGSARGVPSPAAGSFHHDDDSLASAQSGEVGQQQAWQSAGSAGSGGKVSPPVGRSGPGGSEPEGAGGSLTSLHQQHQQSAEYGHEYAHGEGYDDGDEQHHGEEGEEEEEDDGVEYDEDGNPIDEEYLMHHGGQHYDESGYYRSADKRITWSDEHGYALCEVFYCDRLHYSPHYNFEEGTATAHCCVVS